MKSGGHSCTGGSHGSSLAFGVSKPGRWWNPSLQSLQSQNAESHCVLPLLLSSCLPCNCNLIGTLNPLALKRGNEHSQDNQRGTVSFYSSFNYHSRADSIFTCPNIKLTMSCINLTVTFTSFNTCIDKTTIVV